MRMGRLEMEWIGLKILSVLLVMQKGFIVLAEVVRDEKGNVSVLVVMERGFIELVEAGTKPSGRSQSCCNGEGFHRKRNELTGLTPERLSPCCNGEGFHRFY